MQVSSLFTGADLYDNPDVVLGSSLTTVSGTSLVFGPISATSDPFGRLVSVPLSSVGAWADTPGAIITATLNLTRFSSDWGMPIALGNGSQIVGSEIAENRKVVPS